MLETVVLSVHVIAAALLVGLVLIQQGQGADAGAAFGSGASQTLFGSRGAGSFFTRMTTGLALLFFMTSLTLGWLSARNAKQESVVDRVESALVTEVDSINELPGMTVENSGTTAVMELPVVDQDLPVIPD